MSRNHSPHACGTNPTVIVAVSIGDPPKGKPRHRRGDPLNAVRTNYLPTHRIDLSGTNIVTLAGNAASLGIVDKADTLTELIVNPLSHLATGYTDLSSVTHLAAVNADTLKNASPAALHCTEGGDGLHRFDGSVTGAMLLNGRDDGLDRDPGDVGCLHLSGREDPRYGFGHALSDLGRNLADKVKGAFLTTVGTGNFALVAA